MPVGHLPVHFGEPGYLTAGARATILFPLPDVDTGNESFPLDIVCSAEGPRRRDVLEVDFEGLPGLILFGVLHWILALMLLQDLSERQRVVGGRKAPWAVVILLFTFLGSLAYLLCHPAIFTEEQEQ